ncbi:MAG: HEAT repeat domain-containing protein, partial [Planctomycetota bacterium]
GLEDDDGWVRRECAEALGRLGSAAVDAVPGLIVRVDDEYRPARDQAIAALWKLGAPAVKVLVSEFKETQDRRPLIDALAAGGRKALPWLMPLLESVDAPYARDAERALAAVGWEALVVLPAEGASAERIAALVLGDGVRRYCTPSDGFQLELVPGPRAEPRDVDVVWETGSGHGFTLSLHRSRWVESSLCVRKLSYAWQRPRRAGERGAERVGVRETTIPRLRAEAMLRMTVAATGLRVEEKPLADEDSERRTYWSSSANFHTAVVLRAGERVLFRETFTGYSGSLAEVEYARVETCAKILREALETCVWVDAEVSDEDRAVLAARLSRAQEDEWWVRERLLLMAREIGDERCLVPLQALIESEPERIPRRHRYAMDAYARISGVDLRPIPFKDEDVAATRRKYVAYFKEHGESRRGDR